MVSGRHHRQGVAEPHPRRIIDAAAMGTSVVTGSVSPGEALVGAAVMIGRAAAVPSPFSRYGGEKICPSRWLTLQSRGAA